MKKQPIIFKYNGVPEFNSLWDKYSIPKLVKANRGALCEFTKKVQDNSETTPSEIIGKLRKRLPENVFSPIHSSINTLYDYSSDLFPAFRELFPEFLSSEWLALVDTRQKFHRDHIVHQVQTALVVRQLLFEMEFSHEHIKNWLCGLEMPEGISDPCYLLDVCALIMLHFDETIIRMNIKERHSPAAIWNYAYMLGLRDYFAGAKMKRLEKLERWREAIYVTAITAACYHDMGYVFSFAGSILRPLKPFLDFCSADCFDMEYLQRTAGNTLFMHNFTGVYDWYTHPATGLEPKNLQEIIKHACNKTHGLYSAHAFVSLNEYLRDRSSSPDPWAQLIIQWAASAILMHDMQKVREKTKEIDSSCYENDYLRVSLKEDPVAFVLTLADQIQGYNRYSAYPNGSPPNGKINLNLESPLKEVKMIYDNLSKVELVYKFWGQREEYFRVLHRDEFFPTMEKEYFDGKKGYLDTSGLFHIIRPKAE